MASVIGTIAKRYDTVKKLTDNGKNSKWKNIGGDNDVANKQEADFLEAAKLLLLLASDADLKESLGIVESWCLADQSDESLDPTSSHFFPVITRERGKPFPVMSPMVTLTEAGASKLARARRIHEEGEDARAPRGLDAKTCKHAYLRPGMGLAAGFQPTIGDVPLVKWDPTVTEYNSTDERPDITPTASWFGQTDSRYSEAQRNMPYALSSYYMLWLRFMVDMDMDHEKRRAHGLVCLGAGILWLNIEWLGQQTASMQPKSIDPNPRTMLEGWLIGKPGSMPRFIDPWRRRKLVQHIVPADVGMTPDPKKPDIGLSEWSAVQLSKRPDRAAVAKGEVVPPPEEFESLVAFVERDIGAPAITTAATSTSAPLRCFLALNAAIETTGASHLDGFHDYYVEVLRYLGEEPGRRGKKLAGIVDDVAHMILVSPRKVYGPVTAVLAAEGPITPVCAWHTVDDKYGRECMAAKHGVSDDLASIGRVVFNRHPRLSPALEEIYLEYSARPVSSRQTGVLDAVTHLSHPGSIEGYSKSCVASLGAAAYVSYEFRRSEGIDSDVLYVDGTADTVQTELPITLAEQVEWKKVISLLQVPSVKDLQERIIKLSAAKSSGNDKVRVSTTRGIALGGGVLKKDDDDKYHGVTTNKKNGTLTLSGDLQTTKFHVTATVGAPFQAGLRSTAARIMRFIYNLPVSQQAILMPLYDALGDMMKDKEEYSLKTHRGVAMSDAYTQVVSSIEMFLIDGIVSIADDASKLDQHKGKRSRHALISLLRQAAKTRAAGAGFAEAYGEGATYIGLLCDMLESWDESFYTISVDKTAGITLLLRIDTAPSGGLITAEDNTIVGGAALQVMEDDTGHPALLKRKWGDDSYSKMKLRHGQKLSELITARSESGLRSGQVFNTLDGAMNGKVLHYLQVAYYFGQAIKRRISIDHEHPVKPTMRLGEISSLVSKYVEMGERGGNINMVNMLMLLTIVQSSRAKLFGKQTFMPFSAICAPGGTTNMILGGFPAPNSRLWLLLNWENISSLMDGEMENIRKRPVLETASKVGRRVLNATLKDGTEMVVKCETSGDKTSETLSLRLSNVQKALQNPERLASSERLGVTDRADVEEHKIVPYSGWVRRSAEKAIGEIVQGKYYARDFQDASLIASGYMPVKRGSTEVPTPEEKPIQRYKGIKIGHTIIDFGQSTDTYLTMAESRDGETYDYLLYVKGKYVQAYPTRWHPYWSRGTYMVLALGFLGVSASDYAIGISVFKNKFNPSLFRTDISAEEVIRSISSVTVAQAQTFMRAMGFDENAIQEATPYIPLIDVMADLGEAAEYAGLDDLLKSTATDRILEMFNYCSPGYNLADMGVSSVAYTLFISLLVDEFNVACMGTDDPLELKIRIPQIMTTK